MAVPFALAKDATYLAGTVWEAEELESGVNGSRRGEGRDVGVRILRPSIRDDASLRHYLLSWTRYGTGYSIGLDPDHHPRAAAGSGDDRAQIGQLWLSGSHWPHSPTNLTELGLSGPYVGTLSNQPPPLANEVRRFNLWGVGGDCTQSLHRSIRQVDSDLSVQILRCHWQTGKRNISS